MRGNVCGEYSIIPQDNLRKCLISNKYRTP